MITREEYEAYLLTLPGKKRRCLQYIAQGSSMTETATALNVHESTIYNWRHKPEYEEAFQFALDSAVIKFENILSICAEKSLTDARYQASLKLYLQAHRRNKYGDRITQEITTPTKEIVGIDLPPGKDE